MVPERTGWISKQQESIILQSPTHPEPMQRQLANCIRPCTFHSQKNSQPEFSNIQRRMDPLHRYGTCRKNHRNHWSWCYRPCCRQMCPWVSMNVISYDPFMDISYASEHSIKICGFEELLLNQILLLCICLLQLRHGI